jgi:thiol:disulfide interchange protein DsbD
VIDYYAKWCAACNELDHKTWSDPEVAKAAQRFMRVRVDLTRNADEDVADLPQTKGFDLKGLPSVLFLGADGKEIKALRLEQFEAAPLMLQRLSKVP